MNLNDLANLGQIIGALAAVISLFYVAYQILRQTPKDSRRILLPIERVQPAFWEWKSRAGLRFET